MKTFLALALTMLIVMPAFGQYEKLPQLEEWYSLPGGQPYLSYLPNFDNEGNGKNALGLKYYTSGTWYNRFPFDTMNQFSWSGNGYFKIVQGDFNGDKIVDYMDSQGWLYLGIANGKPPSATFSLRPITNLNMHTTVVGDFTADGIDDIITSGKSMPEIGGTDGYLIMGNSDTNRIRSLPFIIPQNHTRNNLLLAAYINNGKGRIISYGYEDTGEGFYLWSVELETTGDPTLKLTLLDKVEQHRIAGAELIYTYYNSGMVKVSDNNIAFLAVKTATSSIYQIANDTFQFQYENYIREGHFQSLERAIDKSGNPGWSRLSLFGKWIVFYSGSPADDTLPKAVFPGYYQTDRLAEKIASIGDINGDGAGDVAIAFSGKSGRSFVIVKGITSTGVAEQDCPSFQMGQSIPSPVSANSQGVVTVSIERQGNYSLSLYSLSGGEIGKIFSGELVPGEHRFLIEPKRFGLTPGLYNLRLTDGRRTRDHGFMVGGK